uniref:Uncharacterized protein n=1 Tax=Physcomitrium patens TaxID=3218 RepID=A0A2K1JVK3_PHYPA|nr:hypothetical protein PHYPA_015325 [Physcomitrium patens]
MILLLCTLHSSAALTTWQEMLFSGPRGMQNTLLARAISRASCLPFMIPCPAEFVQSCTRNGSDKKLDVFFTARTNASL